MTLAAHPSNGETLTNVDDALRDFDRDACRRWRRRGALLCLIAYVAAIVDGGVLIGHSTSIIPERMTNVLAIASAVACTLACQGIWLLTCSDPDEPKRFLTLRRLIRLTLPVFGVFMAQRIARSLEIQNAFTEATAFSITCILGSIVLWLLAFHIRRIARIAKAPKLRFCCTAVIFLLGLAYLTVLGIFVTGLLVGIDWTDSKSQPHTKLPQWMDLAIGGALLYVIVGVGVSFMLYEQILTKLLFALKPGRVALQSTAFDPMTDR